MPPSSSLPPSSPGALWARELAWRVVEAVTDRLGRPVDAAQRLKLVDAAERAIEEFRRDTALPAPKTVQTEDDGNVLFA